MSVGDSFVEAMSAAVRFAEERWGPGMGWAVAIGLIVLLGAATWFAIAWYS